MGPLPLHFFYGELPTEFLSDPRCTFDKSTDTFFLTVLAIDPSGTASHIDVAVLTPALTETFYRFDTTDAANANCPCFADQPYIGPDTSCDGPFDPCRWGDYSAAVLDPGSTNIWMATEYIPPVSSQSVPAANWGTRVYEVSA